MTPLKITAHLLSGLSVSDDYSPDLASILEFFWLQEQNLLQANPTADSIVAAEIPVKKHLLGGSWLWAVSAPIYQYNIEYIDKARKRWDADLNHPINWGKKKAKIQTDGGPYKSADKPVPIRTTDALHWYAVGDKAAVLSLLRKCTSIGHRRAAGCGQVHRWAVEQVDFDWSLAREGQLMTPLPQSISEFAPEMDLANIRIMRWNTKAPRWDRSHAELCLMPVGLVAAVSSSSLPGIP